jgi:hypothetical protein
VSAALPIPLIQLLQVLTVALAAPGITGVIARVEARLQGRRGPRIAQPYYDLAKLFRKAAKCAVLSPEHEDNLRANRMPISFPRRAGLYA